MALFKIDDWYPDYKDRFFDGSDLKGVTVYARGDNSSEAKVGTVDNILVNEAGRIRYLVVDTGAWIFGKKVIVPVGRCKDDPDHSRVWVSGLTKQQVERLPEYRSEMVVDYDYEEQVRSVYRTPTADASVPVEMSVPVERAGIKGYSQTQISQPPVAPPAPLQPEPARRSTYDRSTYDHDSEPELYAMSDENHRRLRLYEERLVADKRRQKTGEVKVSKKIVTEQAEAAIPVEKEKIVIEIDSTVADTRINTPDGTFTDGEVAQVDVYEERAKVCKEPVVRQEVNIRKEVEEDVVTVRDTVRREELDVTTEGTPDVTDKRR